MSRRHHPPAHLRYLRARLWNLARPGFWGTAIFLSAVGLLVKEYWTHPDFFNNWQKNQVTVPANSSLSEEDKAIAADIDNLPVLFNSGPDQENSQQTTTPKPNNQAANNSKSLLDALNSKNQTSASDEKSKASIKEGDSAPAQKLDNPFVAQAENLLRLTPVPGGNKLPEVNASTPSFGQQNSFVGTGLANQTTLNQNIGSENALQTAINQSKNQNQPSLNSTTSTQINPFEPSQLSNGNRRNQILVPSTGLSRDTINPLNIGTGSTQSGLTSGTTYIQPGVTQPQNTISGTSYPQPGFNNLLPQNSLPGTSYIQPRVTQPQNTISGTTYPQPGLNNLSPQNSLPGTSYIQPGVTHLQNSLPRTGYSQPQPGLTTIPQTPSAVPNNSNTFLNQIRSNRLNNVNNGQSLPNVTQPTSVVPPTSAIPNNIAPNYTPNQGGVISNTPGIVNNYGNTGLQQAPAPVPQYIYSSPRQIPGQYTGGGQININR